MVRRLGRPVLDAVIRRALVGRAVTGLGHGRTLTRREVDEILGRLWAHFDELGHTVPWEPTFGSRMNVALAAVTIATHRALGEVGIVGPEATDLIRTIAWRIYRIWGGVPAAIARLATRDPVRRLRVSTALFRRFPFNPPGYRMKDLPATDAVAFDVDRCPVADYFRAQGQSDLCVRTWCALDEPLAELWGGTLERRGTLAGGAARCDFRWLPREKPARRAR
jgi:ubiquinone biosynthesis protein